MNRLMPCAALIAVLSAVTAAAHPPQESAPTSVTTPDARRADLSRFRSKFLERDRSYSAGARAEAQARLAKLEASVADVSQAYFELELARIVALADNGHTVAFPGPRSRRYDRIGIRLVPFGEDFYVLRARESDTELLGARLVAIDDRPIADLRRVARTLVGGVPAWRDR